MSYGIIVKMERNEKNELLARNFNCHYEQCIAMTAEIAQIFGQRTVVFAEARLTRGRQLIILRRARDRLW
jgi:hypothetical protein